MQLIKEYISFGYFIHYAKLFFSGVLIFLLEKKFKNFKYLLTGTTLFFLFSFIVNFYFFIFIPSLVMFFVLIDRVIIFDRLKKILQTLGNLTYSMYLLHTFTFLFLLFFLKLFNKTSYFYLNSVFIFYLATTVVLSFFSYHYFEKFWNEKIRKNFIY